MLPTYVLHAAFLTDRKDRIAGQLAAARVPFEWVTDEELPGSWFAAGAPLSKAQMSCSVKHVAALQRFAKGGAPFGLVIEDDAILSRDFAAQLAAIAAEFAALTGPRVAYIGAGDNWFVPRRDRRRGRRLYPMPNSRTTDAYLITREAADLRLEWLRSHPMNLPIGHVFNLCDPDLGITGYWSHPPIVVQGSFDGTYASAIHQKRPQWFQRILFAYKSVTRRLKA